MLQNPGAGYAAFFGHMADDDHRNMQAFSQKRQLGCAFADLPHAARGAFQFTCEHGLDRIDDDQGGLILRHSRQDLIHIRLGPKPQIRRVATHPGRTQLDLLHGFLSGHIPDTGPLSRSLGRCLKQQRGFADPRIPSQQDHGAGHQSAAQDTVQFLDPQIQPFNGIVLDRFHRQGSFLHRNHD